MASVTISKGQYLYKAGDSVKEIFVVAKGSFLVTFPGGSYTLTKGEVPGICEADSDLHSSTCQALEDSSVLVCSINGLASLSSILKSNADYGMVFARSAFRQANALMQQFETTRLNYRNIYRACSSDYSYYQECCMRNHVKPRSLEAQEALTPLPEELPTAPWTPAYYDGFQRLLSTSASAVLCKEPSVLTGLIAGICEDYRNTLPALADFAEQQKLITSILLNDNSEDIFDLYSSLYLKLGSECADGDNLYQTILRILQYCSKSPYADRSLAEKRVADFKESIKTMAPMGTSEEDASPIAMQLNDSLQTILSYSGMDDEFCDEFTKLIQQYRNLADRNAADDQARALRQKITLSFYKIYNRIFFRAVNAFDIPPVIRMFLYFGYVDENLAGSANANVLYRLSNILSENCSDNIYTLYDWLVAIHEGKKEPSRNEFDQDYTEYVHTLKVSGQIDANEETRMVQDNEKRVEYELNNMFPTVNKITFGRISTFCPVFSDHNVLRQLDASFVSEFKIADALEKIEALDYSAFYREYVYTNTEAGIPKEFLHTHVAPDFILMPGIGTRGAMWQEIEGRRRSTPARMILPIFYLEDLYSAIIRLTAEYRWEMCKRVQGAHWNDLSERSLTSEYCDYIQFYRRNNDLSPEAKEKIKNTLQKARNSFKEMFVRDYITYITYEGVGSPRLNKIARGIIFTYCPFTKKTRNELSTNPIFKEVIDREAAQRNKALHKVDMLEKRILGTGKSCPPELLAERAYYES